jgi:hypothetical protein
MKRAITFIVLVAFFLAYIHAALLPPFPAPAVFWSGERYFSSKQEQCLTTVSEVEISSFVSSVSGAVEKNVLSGFVSSDAQRPEVVVVFVEQEAQPSREAYSFLQTFLDSAASSLVVPYAYPNARVSDAILNKMSQSAILSGLSSDEEVLGYFDNHRAILSDGKTNVIVVQIASGDASLIGAVEQRLSGSSYVLGYAADASFRAAEKSTRMVALSALDSDLVVEHTYGGEYWPADVWSGIVISVTLLILLAIGIGCMFELQTPTRWEKTKRTIREIN